MTPRSSDEPQDSAGETDHQDEPEQTVFIRGSGLGKASYRSTNMYQLLVESVSDYAIFLLDSSGNVVSWNEGAQRIKGYQASEIIGLHFSIFYPPEDLAWGKPAYELEVAAREGRFEDEGWRLRKDGNLFWANVVITALRNDDGDLVGFAKVTRDLTERRKATARALEDARRLAASEEIERANVKLQAAMAEVERANLAKSEFLATMSHELRTPLNAIGGYAELLMMGLRGPVTEEQRLDLERIQRSQKHLLGIINDILNFSRLEAGYLTYDIEQVPVSDILDSVSTMIAPQAKAKGITYHVERCWPEVVLSADRAKVEQILLNLLSNAVKFTPPGGRVALVCAGDADPDAGADVPQAILRVDDTGPGIPPDKRTAIFEPFVQINSGLTAPTGGTGLGLAISRDLARAMGGDITVEEKAGDGATFTLRLPSVNLGGS